MDFSRTSTLDSLILDSNLLLSSPSCRATGINDEVSFSSLHNAIDEGLLPGDLGVFDIGLYPSEEHKTTSAKQQQRMEGEEEKDEQVYSKQQQQQEQSEEGEIFFPGHEEEKSEILSQKAQHQQQQLQQLQSFSIFSQDTCNEFARSMEDDEGLIMDPSDSFIDVLDTGLTSSSSECLKKMNDEHFEVKETKEDSSLLSSVGGGDLNFTLDDDEMMSLHHESFEGDKDLARKSQIAEIQGELIKSSASSSFDAVSTTNGVTSFNYAVSSPSPTFNPLLPSFYDSADIAQQFLYSSGNSPCKIAPEKLTYIDYNFVAVRQPQFAMTTRHAQKKESSTKKIVKRRRSERNKAIFRLQRSMERGNDRIPTGGSITASSDFVSVSSNGIGRRTSKATISRINNRGGQSSTQISSDTSSSNNNNNNDSSSSSNNNNNNNNNNNSNNNNNNNNYYNSNNSSSNSNSTSNNNNENPGIRQQQSDEEDDEEDDDNKRSNRKRNEHADEFATSSNKSRSKPKPLSPENSDDDEGGDRSTYGKLSFSGVNPRRLGPKVPEPMSEYQRRVVKMLELSLPDGPETVELLHRERVLLSASNPRTPKASSDFHRKAGDAALCAAGVVKNDQVFAFDHENYRLCNFFKEHGLVGPSASLMALSKSAANRLRVLDNMFWYDFKFSGSPMSYFRLVHDEQGTMYCRYKYHSPKRHLQAIIFHRCFSPSSDITLPVFIIYENHQPKKDR